jgi:hypothetical protein
MGGPVERPIEMSTSDIVLDFPLTYAHFAVSLQDTMVIVLKRSQEETFLSPEEWVTFIMSNYSHSRIPPCAPVRTHGQIQAPIEPPN